MDTVFIDDLAFIGNMLNRQADTRSDDMVLRLRAAHPLYVLMQGPMLIYKDVLEPSEIYLQESDLENFKPNFKEACYLGQYDKRPVIALFHQGEQDERVSPPFKTVSLRESFVSGLFPKKESGVLAQAGGLLNWHKSHGFCSQCGAKSAIADGGAKRVCEKCYKEHFPRTDPVAIMLVHKEDKCLLARTPSFEKGVYSCLAGFVEPGESLEQTVRRESFEEMGIKIGEVTYLASQPWPFVHSLMFGCHAKALSHDITIDYQEMEDGRWFSRDEVAKMFHGTHKDNITLPPKGAIAHYLIGAWFDKKN